eukprot:m.98162 g.98162  ORF g.98162 m.98162 type:complete len:318 (+) comp14859_c0_seq3:58-1011(+)
MSFPDGCFPTMITPMHDDGSIDYRRLDAITEWYIQSGCTGLFVNCLSSEMFHLTTDERIAITKAVKTKAAGRVTVVSSGGLNCSTVQENAAFVNQIAPECDAVVMVVNQMAAEQESDDVWKQNVQKLLDLTGDVPLGLYECPKPYHRLLSPELLAWTASTGRFYFHKDTCCETKPIKAKLLCLQNLPQDVPFKFYNANVATLLMSVRAGGNGFSGISANFYPHLLVWLAANPDHELSDYVQAMLAVMENVVADKYPAAAKVFQGMFPGFEGSAICRNMATDLNEEQQLKVAALHVVADRLSQDLGLTPINPAKFLQD